MICNETTTRVLEDQRRSLLVSLDDQMRVSSNPEEIITLALNALGKHLRASRAVFGEIVEDTGSLDVKTYYADRVAPLTGRYSLEDLGAEWATQQRQGNTVVRDVAEADNTLHPALWGSSEIRSLVSVPMIRDGQLRAVLMINDSRAHSWSTQEVLLIEQIAARLWATVERRRAQSQLLVTTKRFELALSGSPIVVFTQDLELRYTWICNPALGYEAQSVIGKRDIDLFERPGDAAMVESFKREAIQTLTKLRREVCIHANGVDRFYDLLVDPTLDPDGHVSGITCVAIDITANKQAEEARQLLVGELAHRVKNTLAMVQAIARQTFKGTSVPADMREAFERRIAALGSAHDVLTRTDWGSPLLATLADESLYFCGPARSRVTLSGPDIRVSPDRAIAITMALHELCTNAVKYGALSNESGSVDLSWRIDAVAPQLVVEWLERDGPTVAVPSRRGFGSKMIERVLSQQLQGTVDLEFRPEGVRCRIDIPLVSSTNIS